MRARDARCGNDDEQRDIAAVPQPAEQKAHHDYREGDDGRQPSGTDETPAHVACQLR